VRRRVLAEGTVRLTLGRSIATPTGAVELEDERMSREHAAVERVGALWQVKDLGSRNGTFIDGERISGEVHVRGDAVVRCGYTVFLLLADVRGHDKDHDRGEWVIGPELDRVLDDVGRHAAGPTLLIHGESGSGKELVARHYHDSGPRAGGPFVPVNCAAIPEGVAERLLFGAKKGAFSGATSDAIGYLQSADGGTLFLDEVAELDAAVQAKLLRALETREVVPVGASAGSKIDVGIVAASHRDLRAAVAARRFRDDLYYRLAHPVVIVPSLRHRRADIPRLVAREVAKVDRKLAVHARLIETCCIRPWPGNVRELARAVREAAAAALAASRDVVRPEDLPPTAGLPVGAEAGEVPMSTPPSSPPLSSSVGPAKAKVAPAEIDREAIEAALAAAGGNVSAAARALGLHRTQLYRLLQRHGLARPGDDSDE